MRCCAKPNQAYATYRLGTLPLRLNAEESPCSESFKSKLDALTVLNSLFGAINESVRLQARRNVRWRKKRQNATAFVE
jgi:hypothetical protein